MIVNFRLDINKRKQKLTIEEKCNILQSLKDGTQTNICNLHNIHNAIYNKSIITRVKNNNENIQNFVKISIQSLKNINRIFCQSARC